MVELSKLFLELNERVVEQEAQTVQVEEQTVQVNEDAKHANTQLDQGIKSARRARKLKWWSLLVFIIIIAIIALVLGIYFGVVVPNRNKNNGNYKLATPNSEPGYTRSRTDPDRSQFSAHRQNEQRRDELEPSTSAVTIGMTVPCGPACALGPVPWLLLDAWLDPQQRH